MKSARCLRVLQALDAHNFQRRGRVSKSSSLSQPEASAAALASASAWLVVNALLRLASLSASAAARALDLRMRFGLTAETPNRAQHTAPPQHNIAAPKTGLTHDINSNGVIGVLGVTSQDVCDCAPFSVAC